MNISIVGRHYEVSDKLKSFIQDTIHRLDRYHLNIINVRAIVSSETKKSKQMYSVEFTINLPHKNTIVIKQVDDEIHSAIDVGISRAEKKMRRLHDRLTDHTGITSLGEIGSQELEKQELKENEEDEIIPVELDLYKPLEIEEALNHLKTSNQEFFVFNDHNGKMRVIYKRNDKSFGLY